VTDRQGAGGVDDQRHGWVQIEQLGSMA
jgi:hypothetical protein